MRSTATWSFTPRRRAWERESGSCRATAARRRTCTTRSGTAAAAGWKEAGGSRREGKCARTDVSAKQSLHRGPHTRATDTIIDLGAGPLQPGLEPRVVPNLVVDPRGDHAEVLAFRGDGVRSHEPRERLFRVGGPRVVLRQPPRRADGGGVRVPVCSRGERGA